MYRNGKSRVKNTSTFGGIQFVNHVMLLNQLWKLKWLERNKCNKLIIKYKRALKKTCFMDNNQNRKRSMGWNWHKWEIYASFHVI
jgi:hypothetical protein